MRLCHDAVLARVGARSPQRGGADWVTVIAGCRSAAVRKQRRSVAICARCAKLQFTLLGMRESASILRLGVPARVQGPGALEALSRSPT